MTSYDERSTLVVVDMQNDFADPAGSLYVPGGDEIVDAVNREIDRATQAGALVVYTQDWHPEHSPHFAPDGGIWPVHCVADTWGAEWYPRLKVTTGERVVVVRKGMGGEDGYSGFSVRDPLTGTESATGLEETLRTYEIERVVVVGLATEYCVKETAIDAARLGFATTVLTEAVRAVELQESDEARAFEEMRQAGVTPS
jgi:nicotinamidase/pyrazinamidase